ncbi:iron-hydroxamate ABC transporter substrate-binding protein [Terrisporobacter sp.]
MKKLKSLVVLGVALMAFGLIGCSSNNKTEEQSKTRIVETAKGKVEIPADPKRIVDISGDSEELILLGHNVVGTANVDSYDTSKVPSYMKDSLGDAKVVGHSMMETADIEAILACDPDLIIMSTRQEKIYDQLKEIAPTVVLKDNSNNWETKLKDVAKLFGEEDKANAWLDAYYKKAEKLGEEIKKANGKDTTYLTVLANSGSFMVFSDGGIGTVLKDDMKLPQPANMPKQDSITLPTVTMEGLSKIDPDHIIVIATDSDKADLKASSVWSQIRAVKEGNVTILNASPYFSQAYNPIGRELILESVKDDVIKK